MNIKIEKTPLKQGQVRIISSKSDGHRSLIAAALAEEESVLFVDGWSEDMEATARCLQSLGAEIEREPSGIYVMPIGCPLPCPVDRQMDRALDRQMDSFVPSTAAKAVPPSVFCSRLRAHWESIAASKARGDSPNARLAFCWMRWQGMAARQTATTFLLHW
mgnify:CR=1 FL=1